jgi:type I restriction enzyme S subunit
MLALQGASSLQAEIAVPPQPRDDESEFQLPNNWVVACVNDIADVSVGGTPSRTEPRYWDGGIPWVSSGEVANCRLRTTRETISQLGIENSNAKLVPAGSVLIAMIGEGKTRGQSALLEIEAATNQNVASLHIKRERADPEFVWLWALKEYENTRAVGRGGNQPALNGAKVRALQLALPPLEEQAEIVRRVQALFLLADTIQGRVSEALTGAEKLPEAILGRAFAGELVPIEAELARSGDRDYETASRLLERIRPEGSPEAVQNSRATAPCPEAGR